jgi:hypothetical protein
MNQYSILKMAREAGLLRGGDGWTMPHRWGITELERFAALIEQYLSYDGIHTCHAECQRPACVAMREEVKAEREACAQIAFNAKTYIEAAAAIRSRGEK